MQLPVTFIDRMKEMLGEEFPEFLASYDQPREYGLRINTLKTSCEEFEKRVPFPVSRIPWVKNGYFYGEGILPSRDILYPLGVYYLQEPSAMTPASRLPITPGEKVLDLCAAPGGKATELAASLKGEGILVANDLSNARTKALLRNLELFGTENLLVTNETPEHLREVFPEYFDKILVDAPCSGEGMFRKAPEVVDTWSPDRVATFAATQREILNCAYAMLRPGGTMLYSTCTFSPDENEGNIDWFLTEHPDMNVLPVAPYEGFSNGRPEWSRSGNPDLALTVRIWPHKMNGEGHFLALLQKTGEREDSLSWNGAGISDLLPEGGSDFGESRTDRKKKDKKDKKNKKNRGSEKGSGNGTASGTPGKEARELLAKFFEELGVEYPLEQLVVYGERVYRKMDLPASVSRLNFLRSGLFLGELKKNRFEPSEPLALSLAGKDVRQTLSLTREDSRVNAYLRGESFSVGEEEQTKAQIQDGWVLLLAEGYPLGFGKLVRGIMKNKYPSGWRV